MRRLIPTLITFFAVTTPANAAWVWPVSGAVITPYRNGTDPYASGQHRGIDIAAAVGTPVVAASGGDVRFAGTAGSSGLTISVRTPDGHDSSYLHLSSLAVRAGTHVSTGDRIGAVGTTGVRSATAPHLHFGVRDAGTRHDYQDPLALLPVAPPPHAPEPPATAPAPSAQPAPPAAVPTGAPVRAPRVAPGTAPAARPEIRWTRRPEGRAAPRPERRSAPRPERRSAPRPERRSAPRLERRSASHRVGAREPSPPALPDAAPRSADERLLRSGSATAPARRARTFPARRPGTAHAAREQTRPATPAHQHGRGPDFAPAARRVDVPVPRSLTRLAPPAAGARRPSSEGGPDIAWAAACAGLLLAAALLGLSADRKGPRSRRHARRSRGLGPGAAPVRATPRG